MKFQLERRRPSRGHLHRPVSRRKRLDTRVRRIQPIIVRAIESQTSSERFKQDVARRQPLPAYVRQGPLPLQQKVFLLETAEFFSSNTFRNGESDGIFVRF